MIIAFSPAGGRAALAQAIHGPPEAAAVEATIRGRAEQAAAIEAVIARIADDPGAVRSIVGAQVAATPAYREGIAASAIAAYPGFAGAIVGAAGYAPPPPTPLPPVASLAAPVFVPEPIAPLPITIAATADDETPAFGASLLAALRLGVLVQDINFIGTSFEDGQAINPEIQFAAPDFLDFVLSPRPTLGGTVSTAGGTNTLYGGLNWHFRPFGQFEPFEPLFLDFFFGLSLHDGNSTDDNTADNKTLGCDVLFRQALELGVEIADHYTLSVMVSHLSHGEILCPGSRNRGMDHLGVRLGYEF